MTGTNPSSYAICPPIIFEYPAPTIDADLTAPSSIKHSKLKRTYYFDESLRRLQEAGYERHPRPNEFYQLMLKYLGRESLSIDESAVLHDMMRPLDVSHEDQPYYGEFLSAAIGLKDMMLILSIDPKGLRRYSKPVYGSVYSYRYAKEDAFTCSDTLKFKVRKKHGHMIFLKDVDGLAEYLFARPFEHLPSTEQILPGGGQGIKEMRIFVDEELGPNEVAPIGFGTGFNKLRGFFDIVTYYERASRGVKKFVPETEPSNDYNFFTW